MILYYRFLKYGSHGVRNEDVRVCIGDIYLRKYMPKHMELTNNINNITCGCENCISAMLLQYNFNKWRVELLAQLDKLYINAASSRILQRSKKYYIEYKNQIFPNNPHIHLRACNAMS